MNKIFALLFLSLFLVACNKDGSGDGACSATSVEAQEAGSTDCTVTPPVTGETTGATDGGGTTGDTAGATTGGGTTGSTTGGSTTGSTTGGTTGATTGGTTGSTTGGTTGGGTTGSSTGGSTGLPTEAYTFDTDILFVNTTATQQEKFDKAIEMIKAVVATEEFRDRVLNHTYNGKITFVDNGGFTNAQIYQKILEAAEKLFPAKNNTMNMEVELYYAATSTVGYTYANSKRIWVNTKYFNTNAVSGVASNLFHEWLHKVGFGHASSYSTSRDYSVPYAIGRIISSIGKTL